MPQRSVVREAVLPSLLLVLAVGGLTGCGGGESPEQPIRLAGSSSAQEGDTVDVTVEMSPDARSTASSVQFQLHYTNAHLEHVNYELEPTVQSDARVQHYPSKASFDLGLPLGENASGDSPVLAQFRFRVQETAPGGVPSHLRLADLEVLRGDGEMRRIDRGASHQIAVRTSGGSDTEAAALEVGNQYTLEDTVRIGEVEAPDSARIVIRGTYPDGNKGIVGETVVPPGHRETVKVALDPEFGLSDRKFAFLEAGLYHHEGASGDGSYRWYEVDGQRVQSTFTAHYRTSRPESKIIVEDKSLRNHTLVVDSVIATEPADLVVHRNEEGSPLIPGIIGKARVGKGVNTNVAIDLYEDETVVCGETLWPMLHVRSESEDQPYEIDYPIITEPVTIRCN
jgi:hypothetical protein